jgi:hypothetical protein
VGAFDLILFVLQIAIPSLLAIVAILDWRQFRRARYLILLALYIFFALVVSADYWAASSDPIVCLASYLWVLVAALLHMRSRRIDRAKHTAPPAT